jgi:predicted glutamine amidotransferase
MCQIHVSIGNATIQYTRRAAQELFESNSDGLGFVDFDNPGEAIKILPATSHAAWAFIKANINGKRGVVHWRWRTSGALDLDRVHPYTINDQFYLIHNGVMSEWESKPQRGPDGKLLIENGKMLKDDKSDTQNLAEWLGPLLEDHPGVILTHQFQYMLGEMIGANRLVVVDRYSGEAVIINEHTGSYPLSDIWQANNYAGEYIYVKPKRSKFKSAYSTTTDAEWAEYTRGLGSKYSSKCDFADTEGMSPMSRLNAEDRFAANAALINAEDDPSETFTPSEIRALQSSERATAALTAQPMHPPAKIRFTQDVVAWMTHFKVACPVGVYGNLRTFALAHAGTYGAWLDELEDSFASYIVKGSDQTIRDCVAGLQGLLRVVTPAPPVATLLDSGGIKAVAVDKPAQLALALAGACDQPPM